MTVAELRDLLAKESGDLIVYVGTKTEISRAQRLDHDIFAMQVGPALLIEGAEDDDDT